MGVSIVTVADSISKISLNSGSAIEIKDLDGMIDEVLGRDCPVVMPAPDWLASVEAELDNLGSGTSAQWTFTYILSYRLFYEKVGQGRNKLGDVMPGLANEVVYLIDGIMLNDDLDGCEDIRLAGSPVFGVVEDPVGNSFWGADIEFEVTELVN